MSKNLLNVIEDAVMSFYEEYGSTLPYSADFYRIISTYLKGFQSYQVSFSADGTLNIILSPTLVCCIKYVNEHRIVFCVIVPERPTYLFNIAITPRLKNLKHNLVSLSGYLDLNKYSLQNFLLNFKG